ncbi:MAG: VIT1/CCC1 transporter family protein [Candidatus Omnitrophica bacterium]|nr:VIT1/CCC1 transporter family protein [Candidatus Omnitrophota bacterium]
MADLKEIFGKPPVQHDEDWHSPGGKAIREVVFGFNDGLVSTVGFVMGVSAALPDPRIILIAGLAEVLAGGFSMFFGAYLSSKNQREFFESEIARERFEMEHMPEKEREEIRRIYAAKGFVGAELEAVVRQITSDPKVWLKCMMEEELGLIYESMDNPIKVGFLTGFSFMTAGIIPILPFVYASSDTAMLHTVLFSAVSLFAVGILKTFLTRRPWFRSGLESLTIGLLASGLGYVFGWAASRLAGFVPHP